MVEIYKEPLIINKGKIQKIENDNFKIKSLGFSGQLNIRLSNLDINVFIKYFNIQFPKKINTYTDEKNIQILYLGPDEWLLLCPIDSRFEILEKIESMPFNHNFEITDVSFNRVLIEISGDKCDELISSIASVPESIFTAGNCIQSQMANTQVIMMCINDNYKYNILARSSFCEYLSDVIIDQSNFI